jgi:hypothetical protein
MKCLGLAVLTGMSAYLVLVLTSIADTVPLP